MNKSEVISRVAAQSGQSSETCETIINAFEEQAGDTLVNKFKGIKTESAEVIAAVAARCGQPHETCEAVIASLDGVLDAGLSAKLRFFKRK